MALQTDKQKLILAVPKGRILDQLMPIFGQIGLQPEAAFFDAADRRLRFATNCDDIDVIRVRSFDVATFLAYGAAHLGVAGSDVLVEFDHPEIYALLIWGSANAGWWWLVLLNWLNMMIRVLGLMYVWPQNIRV